MPRIHSTSQQGTYNELLVEVECLARGWLVFRPSRPDGEIDLIVINQRKQIQGLQIRAAHWEKENGRGGRDRLRISLRHGGKNERYSELVTIFVAVKDKRFWIFPSRDFRGSRIKFSERSNKYEDAWHHIGEAVSNLYKAEDSPQLSIVL